ncbi:MAG: hypothetical protein H0W64_08205 [Gammaproteobacteria bacterium]|nr:hypothetical protein [Gammaproteobacteria bacterium]
MTLIIGLMSVANATERYHPPERLTCKLNHLNKLKCHDFNRRLLIEDVSNATLSKDRTDVFNFVSGVAYSSPNHTETSVFFTYNNSKFKMVRLKTIHPSIQPDLANPNWKKFNDDIYTCNASYMDCAITLN